jgi:hypothetical protein
MGTRNLSGGKMKPACRAEKFTAICEPISTTLGSMDVSQPYGFHDPLLGYLYVFLAFIFSFQ